MAVTVLVLILLRYCDGFAAVAAMPETVPKTSELLPKNVALVMMYGAFKEYEDSGKCSRMSSSEDLYEGHVTPDPSRIVTFVRIIARTLPLRPSLGSKLGGLLDGDYFSIIVHE